MQPFLPHWLYRHHGAKNMNEALNVFKSKLKPGAKLVVAWGDKGATGYDLGTGQTITSPAFPPPEGLVDSLGAGDSFNAALIGSLAHGVSLSRESLNQGCKFDFSHPQHSRDSLN